MTCYRDNCYKISTLMSTFKSQNLDKGSEDKSFSLHLSIQSKYLYSEGSLHQLLSRTFLETTSSHSTLYTIAPSSWFFVFAIPLEKSQMTEIRRKLVGTSVVSGFPFLFLNLNLPSKLADRCPYDKLHRCVRKLDVFS